MKGEAALDDEHAHAVAAEGVSGAARSLPHRDTIQRLFGRHDIHHVKAQVGGPADDAARRIGADAYATGQTVAFRSEPDLHTAAHEAAHTVQQTGGVQLAGGVGRSGDTYERHADEVADAVLAGRSAEPLLDQFAGAGGSPTVQKKDAPYDTTQHRIAPLPSGITLADIISELKKEQTATTPGIKSWKAAGVTAGSTEELYVLYAVWQLAAPKRWGTESDIVTEVGPGKKGAIQVRFDAVGNAEGTLVASAPPTVAASFKTPVEAITALKAKFDLTDIKGEKGQTWTLDQLHKLSAAFDRLKGESSALSKYTIILTDNTLTGAGGQPAGGLTTTQDKTSPDGVTAIRVREIRFRVSVFDVDVTSFVGDSMNAAPASFLTLLHEAAHAQESKAVDDANTAEVAATVETNKVIVASNAASAKAVASRNTAVVGHWNKLKAADQTASKPLVTALDAADTAITAFRMEKDATKMAALEAPAQAAVKTRDTVYTAVSATNPAHTAFAPAITDQDAYLKVVQDLLAKRQAQATAIAATTATKDPTGAQSKRLQAFVDFVTANSIEPVTKYAKDNWPAKPQEFYAEAFTMWRNDPTFFGTYSSKLKTWFDTGQHLK
ncbi:MAG TPA: DUF4157 domain-containing protein [Kofleriaceae bacterium]|nr:DUF4157 domain-containing protein [Kofleriaceae bacterium]